MASDQKTIARNLAGPGDRVVPADFIVVTASGMIYFLDGVTAEIRMIDPSGQPRGAV